MTQLEHQVRKAQQRLWLNRWLGHVTIVLVELASFTPERTREV